ncbi:MAG TPA: response regulator [Methylomirabilota bacterium]
MLIIEDDADAREVLQLSLEAEGQPVAVAANGAEGLALAAASPPDVVFLDLRLPGLDGFEVARRLREMLGPDARIIALTGFDRAEDRRATAAAGFDGHLTKPIGADTILAVLAA